ASDRQPSKEHAWTPTFRITHTRAAPSTSHTSITILFKHCWAQVRAIDDKDVLPRPHPLPHFIVRKGLLYCVAQRRGEEKELLVVPRTKTETILELAHSHPMAGHLGAANTIQRIRDRFHWPGLKADVKGFCRACLTCQITAPRTPPPSPLIPLPIIEVPFERIGLDLVGPLPKSVRGHEHILVIVDYATLLGIPVEILTDQGTPFMSRLMADLCRLLRVKQLRTTVYHPQTDGLVERFNQTLKQIHAGLGSHDPLSPRSQLVSPPLSSCLAFNLGGSWTSSLPPTAWSERIDRIMPLLSKPNNATTTGQLNHGSFNRQTVSWSWSPPPPVNSSCHGRDPTRHLPPASTWKAIKQLYHINLLKKWNGTRDQVAALSLTDPVVVDVKPHLSAAQKAELQHLVGQFSDVFSSRPGQTNVIQHDIRMPPGVIVRQRPYRVPEARRQAIEEEVQEMLMLGVIEPSCSPWSSHIVMVPKPDGTLRFCNDFRRYPMPRVNELLDRLGRARYISTLDLTKGYWQVPLTPSAKLKTVFSTPSGHWQYRTLPIGLHGAPAMFQRMMDIILRPHQAYAAAYLDDVVVHSEAWEDHLDPLAGWTNRQPPQMTSSTRRLSTWASKSDGASSARRRQSSRRRPRYEPFWAAPLTDLTRKGQPERICWTAAAEEAFTQIKTALTSSPVLRTPDFSCPFLLQTDASNMGLGAVLSQIQEGEEHP
ncbi:hypothetical protein M9458_010384, partial [Cirrhinus mrigala]